jgi:hypothetical protein
MYKGQLEGFPKEIVEKMLEEQEKQGNKRDVSVFERILSTSYSNGGFTWDLTKENNQFWKEVLEDKNFTLFFEKYPKIYPKVMMVSHMPITEENIGFQRVVFMEKCGKYLTWYTATTIEEAEIETGTLPWKYAKDIEEPKQEVKEVTLEQIAEAFKVDVNNLKIVK